MPRPRGHKWRNPRWCLHLEVHRYFDGIDQCMRCGRWPVRQRNRWLLGRWAKRTID